MNKFLSAPFRLKKADDTRKANHGKALPFGIPFLDCATGGILPDDLVLVTARTGAGKSEMATLIAQASLLSGKFVHMFALEAYEGEVESRLKFKMLADAFYSQSFWKNIGRVPNYLDWRRGINSDLVEKFEPEIDELFIHKFQNLHTLYRESSFTVGDLEEQIGEIWEETDLIILDHLHYFDFDSENENAAMKSTLKKIRDLSLSIRKPIVLVAHVRKKDRGSKSLVAGTEEIHGSSDVGKIATIAISAAPALDQSQNNNFIYPTYLRLCKMRDDSSRTRFVGLCGFNIKGNCYEENFRLGKLSADESEFEEVTGEWPQWARRNQ